MTRHAAVALRPTTIFDKDGKTYKVLANSTLHRILICEDMATHKRHKFQYQPGTMIFCKWTPFLIKN